MGDDFLKEFLGEEHYRKIEAIGNEELNNFLRKFIKKLRPSKAFVSNDSKEDIAYIRNRAIETGEESKLVTEGHTVHFDGYYDQARDKANTKYLLPKGVNLGPNINSIDKDEGLGELDEIMDGIMEGHELFICFYSLGPNNSEFTIPCVQLTDSSYVAHSETILYRPGYEEFKKRKGFEDFFRFVHSEGELENGVSKNIDRRRVYIDLDEQIVYSMNTQYGGNTLGLKKLAMRLAINKASKEGWLTEHMFVMGVNGPGGRVTYFTGAYPSMCGKTSTAMVTGERIVGDDIAYLRNIGGEIRAANVENGMFGIILGINSEDDPEIWKALHTPNEIIFSNILVANGKPYWVGMDDEIPKRGRNHSGEWYKGKKDAEGKEIPASHPNARFTLRLDSLPNRDPKMHDPEGVPVGGIIYGGRDSDTWVPVEQSFDWEHGIITKGASLESETTAATLGQAGIRKYSPMSNLDFLSIPIGRYIQNNIDFGKKADKAPLIFSVNYFLKNDKGEFLNTRQDKRVWLKWMERRVHGEFGTIETPTGLIPVYEDLKLLFKEVLGKDYSKEDYIEQFSLRVPENIAKMDRILEIYKNQVADTPRIVFEVLEAQKKRLEDARAKYGDRISPYAWE